MSRNKHTTRSVKPHGRYVKVHDYPPTWLNVTDDTPDTIVRERFQHRLAQQQNPPAPIGRPKMKNNLGMG
jgi:hypothetical protein